ncbi:hypothetical protein EYV94_11345 [Puteibacter caeruleilacunae]|nr:hypothetical protein EYV94_11345 [Puteibacter caeruleilacunae]
MANTMGKELNIRMVAFVVATMFIVLCGQNIALAKAEGDDPDNKSGKDTPANPALRAEEMRMYKTFRYYIDEGDYDDALSLARQYHAKGFSRKMITECLKGGNFWERNLLKNGTYTNKRLSFSGVHNEIAPSFYQGKLFFNILELGRTSMVNKVNYIEIDGPTGMRPSSALAMLGEENSQDAYVTFSSNGEQVFVNRIKQENGENHISLYQASVSETGELSAVSPCMEKFKKYSIGRTTLSPNGKTMVFSGDLRGGEGEIDLWICTLENGQWSDPVNMGDVVNTRETEGYPYFDANGRLYFSSNGHLGYGGMDLYRTELVNGEWSKPVNLGSPINSTANELGITSDYADNYYYSSDRTGNYDIYIYQSVSTKSMQIATDVENDKNSKGLLTAK